MSKPEKEIKEVCKNCRFWKNRQRELEYTKVYGFCVTHKNAFKTTVTGDVRVLDRYHPQPAGVFPAAQVETVKDQSPQIGVPIKSQYSLVTEEDFGCIHFESQNS